MKIFSARMPITILLTLLVGEIISPLALASNYIVKDYTIRLLTGTPTVGRGYMLQCNELKSTCLENMTIQDPTADLTMTYEEVNDQFRYKLSQFLDVRDIYIYDFLQKYNVSETRRAIFYSVNIDKYYISLAGFPQVYPAALDLVEQGNIYDFIVTCGTGYINSVKKISTLYALFTFNTVDVIQDQAFIDELDIYLRSQPDDALKQKIFQQSSQRELRIHIEAQGLGDILNLEEIKIPTSIDEFQDTVRGLQTMVAQNEAGRIVEFEVIAWDDNPQFKAALSAAGIQGYDIDILLENYEAIANMDNEIDWLHNITRLGNNCYQVLSRDYLTESEAQAIANREGIPLFLIPYYDGDETLLVDYMYPDIAITLNMFKSLLSKQKLNQLTYRLSDVRRMAGNCKAVLDQQNYNQESYLDIPECLDFEDVLLDALYTEQFIEEFCPPTLKE